MPRLELGMFLVLSAAAVACGSSNGDTTTPGPTPDGGPSDAPSGGDGGGGGAACSAGALFPTSKGIIAALAVDGTTVFFTTLANGSGQVTLQSVPVAGGAAQVLATGKTGTALSDLRVDATSAYYFMDGKLSSVAKAGGTPTTLATMTNAIALGFAVDETTIYLGGKEIDTVAKTGGTPAKLFGDSGFDYGNVRVDSGSVYFEKVLFDFHPDAGPTQRTLEKIATTGGAAQSLAQVTTAGGYVVQLEIDGGYIVYSTSPNLIAGTGTSHVYSLPITGGNPTSLSDGGTAVFTASGGYVYFGDSGGLEKMPVAGGAKTPLPGVTFVDAAQFAHDAANIYWSHSGCIYKAPK